MVHKSFSACWYFGLAIALLLGPMNAPGRAAWLRLHYAPTCGSTVLRYQPEASSSGTTASYFGFPPAAPPAAPRPTHIVTFRHPCTGASVSIPISFPNATPRLVYRDSSVVYDYGSYTITVRFAGDGCADVVYDSGLFRSL